jgi:hypothetical protein
MPLSSLQAFIAFSILNYFWQKKTPHFMSLGMQTMSNMLTENNNNNNNNNNNGNNIPKN